MSNEELCAAEIKAAAVTSEIHMEGLKAANAYCLHHQIPPAYCESRFQDLERELTNEVDRLKKHYL